MSKCPFDDQALAAKRWWEQLRPREVNGRSIPGDRAALARLRRASNVMEAASEPATGDLYRRLKFSDPTGDLPRAALIAAVLAHVKKDPEKTILIARAIGSPRGGEETTALITPLRFKRLVSAREPDDLLVAFRRVVAILGGTANVADLARQLLSWTAEHHRDLARTRFAFEYHGAGPFAPDQPSA